MPFNSVFLLKEINLIRIYYSMIGNMRSLLL